MITDKHFIDWENHLFGYGYGTGEEHTLSAIKQFFELCQDDGIYSYEVLEQHLTPTVAWLLINLFCGADIMEYGTSPRFGWLTDAGTLIKEYLNTKTVDELYELVMSPDDDYYFCSPSHCNCEQDGKCNNPLFK